ncbi:MAG: hypothetical protein F4103_11895 [Boseongicola sp. SB0673_bin_14]|nr:hypothetical protein [Boseongicola sp. SB0673_bin_14]
MTAFACSLIVLALAVYVIWYVRANTRTAALDEFERGRESWESRIADLGTVEDMFTPVDDLDAETWDVIRTLPLADLAVLRPAKLPSDDTWGAFLPGPLVRQVADTPGNVALVRTRTDKLKVVAFLDADETCAAGVYARTDTLTQWATLPVVLDGSAA